MNRTAESKCGTVELDRFPLLFRKKLPFYSLLYFSLSLLEVPRARVSRTVCVFEGGNEISTRKIAV